MGEMMNTVKQSAKPEIRAHIHKIFRNFEKQNLPCSFTEILEAQVTNTFNDVKCYLDRLGFTPDDYELEFSCTSRTDWNDDRRKTNVESPPVITARFEWKELS